MRQKGDEPTKAASAKCTYSFAGWDKEIAPVEGDTTYTATFAEKPIGATLTYDPAGGTIDGKSDKVSVTANAGDEVTILDAPTRSGYTFQYWKGSEYQPGDTYVVEEDPDDG